MPARSSSGPGTNPGHAAHNSACTSGVIAGAILSSSIVGAVENRGLLEKLAKAPSDVALRRTVAEAVEAEIAAGADRAEVDRVLAPLVNLTGHDDDTGLPCLCRDCLPRAGTVAEAADTKFHRSFVIDGSRVLHFWLLADQHGKRDSVRGEVRARLEERLGKRAGR